MKLFSFIGRQLLALAAAVLCGYLSGKVLAAVTPVLLTWLPFSGLVQNGLLVRVVFWIIPFLISMLLSILISLLFLRTRKQVTG